MRSFEDIKFDEIYFAENDRITNLMDSNKYYLLLHYGSSFKYELKQTSGSSGYTVDIYFYEIPKEIFIRNNVGYNQLIEKINIGCPDIIFNLDCRCIIDFPILTIWKQRDIVYAVTQDCIVSYDQYLRNTTLFNFLTSPRISKINIIEIANNIDEIIYIIRYKCKLFYLHFPRIELLKQFYLNDYKWNELFFSLSLSDKELLLKTVNEYCSLSDDNSDPNWYKYKINDKLQKFLSLTSFQESIMLISKQLQISNISGEKISINPLIPFSYYLEKPNYYYFKFVGNQSVANGHIHFYIKKIIEDYSDILNSF